MPDKAGTRESSAAGGRTRQPMICERWMTVQVESVTPLDSVAHARALLEERHVNQLPVVRNGVLVGIVTDRDLREAPQRLAAAEGWDAPGKSPPKEPDQIPVEAVMTSTPITLAPHSTLLNAAVVLRRERIGSVPIVDGDRLVGIVTRSDILDAFIARENCRRERGGRRGSTPQETAKTEKH